MYRFSTSRWIYLGSFAAASLPSNSEIWLRPVLHGFAQDLVAEETERHVSKRTEAQQDQEQDSRIPSISRK